MDLLSQTVQYAISGVTAGSIYAVIGICWSVVYLITKVLNFTTGEFVMLGGMLTWAFSSLGFGLLPSVFFAVACTIVISMLLERLVIRPIRLSHRDDLHDDHHRVRLGHQRARPLPVGLRITAH